MKIIRNKNTRLDIEEKIKRALDKKPTAAHLGSKGLTPEQVDKLFGHHRPPEKVRSRIIKGGKQHKRKRVQPRRPHAVRSYPETLPNPNTSFAPVPDWFLTKNPVDVSIIVPMFKSHKVITKQIESWDLEDDGLTKEIIYVDDACPGKSHQQVVVDWENRLGDNRRSIGKILLNGNNVGYGYACNIGAQHASGKYLILLNADARVAKNWIRPIYDRFESDPQIGIVGNLQLKYDGQHIDSAGSEWVWRVGTFEHIGRHSLEAQPTHEAMLWSDLPQRWRQAGEREMVTGCCFAIPRELWNAVQGYDLNFRIGYWEDSDLNLRIREIGYKIWFEPKSVIYHSPGHSGSGGHPFMSYNKEYFYNKWVNNGKIDRYVHDKRHKPIVVNSIYIKRTGAHGDVLVAASFAGALKRKYPNAMLTFATACREVVDGNPYVDKISYTHWSDTKKVARLSSQDLVYDLDRTYEFRPKQHILTAYAEAMGLQPEDSELFIKTIPFTKITLPPKYVIIHAGRTAWAGRNWHVEKFNEIAKKLKDRGFFVVAVGVTRDASLTNANVNLLGETSVFQLAHVIKECQYFFGIDSFPMWLAQTFKKRGVCFFGCVDPNLRLINKKILPVRAEDLECIGCHHEQTIPCIGTSNCKMKNLACEHRVTTDMFWNRVCEVIGE